MTVTRRRDDDDAGENLWTDFVLRRDYYRRRGRKTARARVDYRGTRL